MPPFNEGDFSVSTIEKRKKLRKESKEAKPDGVKIGLAYGGG